MISSLAGGWAGRLFAAIERRKLQLVVSRALLGELEDVISRPRMRKWFDLEDALDLVSALESIAKVVEPQTQVTVCRDPDDNYLLALCEEAGAGMLATRDEDLLVLEKWKKTVIVRPEEFIRRLENEG